MAALTYIRIRGDGRGINMLFELRNSVPQVSASWCETRDRFLAGRSREAWNQAAARRKDASLQSANDYLLNVEIARACGANRTYLALVRLAHRRFPDDAYVRLYHARALLTRSMHTRGIEFLHDCEDSLGRTHRALWATQLANVYADAGFEASCRRWLEAAADEPDIDSPLALYTRSCAFEGLHCWDDAMRLARDCVASAPQWTRARSLLVHCLLTQGRIDAARAEIAEGRRLGHEDAALDITEAMLAFSLGQFAEAQGMFERMLKRWPQGDFIKWLRRTQCIVLVELGDCDAARDLIRGQENELGLPEISSAAAGKPHRFIPLPLVAQNMKQCVPTSVAMAAWPQGKRLEPNRLYREMRGREGTALWRMRRWVETHGFRLVPVRLEKRAIIELLNEGIPLIGPIEGPFNSHVDVVCGYHEGLEVFYVRDPGHWAPAAYPYEMALQRYELHGALLAVIEAGRSDTIARAERLKSTECDALLNLAQAVAEGERVAAEGAVEEIPDDSPVAFLRDRFAVGVAISPDRFHESMQKTAQDEKANGVARFRALLALDSHEALKVLRQLLEDEGGKFGYAALRYLRLLQCMNDGQWKRARRLIDHLLVRGGGIAELWDLKGDVLAELGDQAGSQEALGRAIELEPRRMALREKELNRSADRLTFTEYLEEFDSLLQDDPDEKGLLWGRASALLDGPDGKAYERAARECIRWYPRDPRLYSDLMHWYRTQGRHDAADALLEEGRKLLPDVFPPADGEEGTDLPADEAKDPSEAEKRELPDEKEELLKLVWTPDDARRPEAQQRLAELERDGHLQWFERASLLANRLLDVTENDGRTISEIQELLPRSTPGAAHWFANTVADVLTSHEPSIGVALAVNAWIERVVPDFRSYVGLWFNRVLLLEKAHRMERAFDELKELLDRYPAYSSALYRMGVVKYQQSDYRSAAEFLEKALHVNPGLPGAMQLLRSVQEVLGNEDEALRCLGMLRKKFPYDFDYLQDEVLAVADARTVAAAEAILADCRGEYCRRRIDVLRAQLKLREDRFDEAGRILSEVSVGEEDAPEDLYEDYLRARLDLALARNDKATVLEVCERGLKRWPDSTRLKEIRAEHLAETDPAESRRLLREVLCRGEPRPQTAHQYLELMEEPPDRAARNAVLQAEAERRQTLAELFAEVMSHPVLLSFNAGYLRWALKQFPESDALRYHLAVHYDMSGRTKQAIQLAEDLHRRNPYRPAARALLGRCLLHHDAKKALEHLEKACRQDRSVDCLFDLARCHHLCGDTSRSKQVHWEILSQYPYHSASWTNLFILKASQTKLWPYVKPMLQRGFGVGDEYFLVAVVKVALALREQVAVEWFPLALRRWQVLQTHPGFLDERLRLKRAVLAWLSARPGDGRSVEGKPRGFFDSLSARFFWPRRAWVPQASPAPAS